MSLIGQGRKDRFPQEDPRLRRGLSSPAFVPFIGAEMDVDLGTHALQTTGVITASRLVSTVAIGTAPMTITSTTKVDNLNADLLDGAHAPTYNAPLSTSGGVSPSISISPADATHAGSVPLSGTPATNQYLRATITTGALSWQQIAYADISGTPSLAGYVPYTGATGAVDLGEQLLTCGSEIIDGTSTTALTVRKEAAGGDVFVVDTTNSKVTSTGDTHLGTAHTGTGAGVTLFENAAPGDNSRFRLYGYRTYTGIAAAGQNYLDLYIDTFGRGTLIGGGTGFLGWLFADTLTLGGDAAAVNKTRLVFPSTGRYYVYYHDAAGTTYKHAGLRMGNSASDSAVFALTTNAGFNYSVPLVTDPTLMIFSDNSATGEYLLLTHDGTDGIIKSGTGTITFDNENLRTTGTLGAGASTLASAVIGGASNFTTEAGGDSYWVGAGTGLPYGSMYGHNVAVDVVLTTLDQDYQVLAFATDGPYNLTTLSTANDDITVSKTGTYLVTYSVSCKSAISVDVSFVIKKNNGATGFDGTDLHFDLQAGGNDVAASNTFPIPLTAGDTVELWCHRNNGAAVARTVTIDHVSMSVVMIGG